MYTVNHSWLYGSVKPYFEHKGIKLLKDDLAFIEKCLSNIPPERHRYVMRDYLSMWNMTVEDDGSASNTKLNARFEANTFLRNASGNKVN